MRICVIFNPVAKGEKARRFRRHLDAIGAESALKLTAGPNDARHLAAEAVNEGFDTVVAAGGDGTLNEVLNGLGDAPEGFERARLGVLPLGTVNVFAREMAIPFGLEAAWTAVRQGREICIDLPCVEYVASDPAAAASVPGAVTAASLRREGTASDLAKAAGNLKPGPSASSPPSPGLAPAPATPTSSVTKRYFAQLAGAGLDARAIELVRWELKKRIGPLAYVLAGCQALLGAPARIRAAGSSHTANGGLVLIGNGRLYGGKFRLFPQADLHDGLLEVCAFPRVNWLTLARCALPLLLLHRVPAAVTQVFRAPSLSLTGAGPVPFEVDGELIGHLPATFSVEPSRLRVLVP